MVLAKVHSGLHRDMIRGRASATPHRLKRI
jgi:hypothetical protein